MANTDATPVHLPIKRRILAKNRPFRVSRRPSCRRRWPSRRAPRALRNSAEARETTETLSTAGQSRRSRRLSRIVAAQRRRRTAPRPDEAPLVLFGERRAHLEGLVAPLNGQPHQTKRIESTPSAVASLDTKNPSRARSRMSRSSLSAKVGNGRFSDALVLTRDKRLPSQNLQCAPPPRPREARSPSARSPRMPPPTRSASLAGELMPAARSSRCSTCRADRSHVRAHAMAPSSGDHHAS